MNLTTHRIKVITASGEYSHSFTEITPKCIAVESLDTDDRASAASEAAARELINRAVTKQDRAAVSAQLRARAFMTAVLIDYVARRVFTWSLYMLTCWRTSEPTIPFHSAAIRMQARMCTEERTADYRTAWQAKMERWIAAHPLPTTLSA